MTVEVLEKANELLQKIKNNRDNLEAVKRMFAADVNLKLFCLRSTTNYSDSYKLPEDIKDEIYQIVVKKLGDDFDALDKEFQALRTE